MEKLTLYQKLLQIQTAIMGLGKDKQANSYKYVTGDKVLSEIKPLMNKHNLILKQEIISIENTRQDFKVGKDNRDKSEILTKVMMRFTWIDCETGEKDENLFGANGQNDWEKGLGSALTYAERYFFLKYFHIATDEDDIDNPERKPEPIAQSKSVTKPEVKFMVEAQKTELIRIASLSHVWNEEETKGILAFASNSKNTFDIAKEKIQAAHLKIKERVDILEAKAAGM